MKFLLIIIILIKISIILSNNIEPLYETSDENEETENIQIEDSQNEDSQIEDNEKGGFEIKDMHGGKIINTCINLKIKINYKDGTHDCLNPEYDEEEINKERNKEILNIYMKCSNTTSNNCENTLPKYRLFSYFCRNILNPSSQTYLCNGKGFSNKNDIIQKCNEDCEPFFEFSLDTGILNFKNKNQHVVFTIKYDPSSTEIGKNLRKNLGKILGKNSGKKSIKKINENQSFSIIIFTSIYLIYTIGLIVLIILTN